jgi:pimeloyl-ACP methyl ester carboxylesterase
MPRHYTSRRYCLAILILSTLGVASASAQRPSAAIRTRMVDVGGYRTRVHVSGLDRRKAGTPVVVFENGAGSRLEVWNRVLPRVSSLAPVVAYDRSGLGQSEWDGQAPTPRHVTNRLRSMLERVGAKPPYVLVGYSWGGILVRYFAGYHPRDIAGLVFVDPGPMVTVPLADRLASFEAIGVGRPGFDAYWSRLAALFDRAPPAVRAELDVFRGLVQMDSVDRELLPVPGVPMVAIVAGKHLPLAGFQLPFDARAHFEADVRQRARILQEWTLASPAGTLIVSNHSTHAVPREDPELIVWAVERVLSTLRAASR